MNEVHGGFAFVILRKDQLIAALDPNGFRPLCIGRLSDGGYVVASETCALDMVGAEFVRDVLPGELVIIDENGLRIEHFTTDTELAICSMEYIYFARPDSIIHGVTVHKESGWENCLQRNSRLIAIWSSAFRIHLFQRLQVLQKKQDCRMKWDSLKTNMLPERLFSQRKN